MPCRSVGVTIKILVTKAALMDNSAMDIDVYLDIDGVLLANDFNAANFVHEFLQLVTSQHNTYWLTTHCKGNAQTAVDRLALVMKPETLELVKTIRPTDWQTAKTEAIDFSRPFLVFEDDMYPDERKQLERHRALDNWIMVDLAKDENQLKKFVDSFPIPVRN